MPYPRDFNRSFQASPKAMGRGYTERKPTGGRSSKTPKKLYKLKPEAAADKNRKAATVRGAKRREGHKAGAERERAAAKKARVGRQRETTRNVKGFFRALGR